ncbi:hypothetical protein AB205_0010410, partial [Aquarana catesbeiana]
MDSVNFKNILRWNPPPGFTEDEDIVYKVQYKLDVNKQMKYTDVCMTRDLECDLTYITYTFDARVSAAVGDNQSDWVTIRFEPESKTQPFCCSTSGAKAELRTGIWSKE